MTKLDIDPEHPRCGYCREPEPCLCWLQCDQVCDLCGLLMTPEDERPCHGSTCHLMTPEELHFGPTQGEA